MAATNERMDFVPGVTKDAVEPVAVIGISGRFPGEATNPDKLWELLSNGRSARCEIPKDRFNIDAFYHPHAERQGTLNFKHAHFMKENPAAFDNAFFTITPNEAKSMDPQQRMALECTFEAFENAGLPMESVMGTKTSCFVGSFTQDYKDFIVRDFDDVPTYQSTGSGTAILSNRVSWFYDLKGPSVSIDTACSSSLVALHLACQSIRTGEAEMAIAGGTNYMLVPDIMTSMSTLHFLSPTGKSQAFDEKGNGYSRGEGSSFLICKKLSAAIRDGNTIRAVIRNTGVNQDGNTPGITLPSMDAQEALIRQVYTDAGLDPGRTSYLEAHGPGTPAGDPIETEAASRVISKRRPEGTPLIVGSIKTNVGHLEGASGLAGVTKAIYSLENGVIPPNLWYEKPNPRIPMKEWNLKVPTEMTPYPLPGLRRVSINSFGYGGTNAHIVIDDAYNYLKEHRIRGIHNTKSTIDGEVGSPDSSIDSGFSSDGTNEAPANGTLDTIDNGKLMGMMNAKLAQATPKLLTWSAHEQGVVEKTVENLTAYLTERTQGQSEFAQNELVSRLAYTLNNHRSILPWKGFSIATSSDDLNKQIEDKMVPKPVRSTAAPKMAFVFTGQGAQWNKMGRELCSYDVFADSLRSASAYLVKLGCQWSLIGEVLKNEDAEKINTAAYSQPMCTAIQVALVDLLAFWGVKPMAVVGHSSGEIGAAYAKGAITREEAWSISWHRGRLSSVIPGLAPNLRGGMLAAGLSEEEAKPYLEAVKPNVIVVACVNSGSSVTISGDAAGIDQLEGILKEKQIFARKLKVETAYHSPHMETIADAYLQSMANIRPTEGSADVKMFSSVTGELISGNELGAPYWVRNMLSCVRFLQAVKALTNHSDSGRTRKRSAKSYVDAMLEVGPHPALKGPCKQINDTEDKTKSMTYISTLERNKNAVSAVLTMAGNVFQQGYPIQVAKVNEPTRMPAKQAMLVDLPPFAWNHSKLHWHETAITSSHRNRKHPRMDLFGQNSQDSLDGTPIWRNKLRLSENPWIEEHKIHNTILYPAAGMCVMAIEAARQTADFSRTVEGYELRDVIIDNAMVVPREDSGLETMLTLKPWRLGSQASTAVWTEWHINSRTPDADSWTHNCSGLIRVKYTEKSNPIFVDEKAKETEAQQKRVTDITTACTNNVPVRHFYEHLAGNGFHWSSVFTSLTSVKKGDLKGRTTMDIPDTASLMPMNFEYEHVVHPATLDGVVQMLIPSFTMKNEEVKNASVPTSFGRVYVSEKMMGHKAGKTLEGFAHSIQLGFRDTEAYVTVYAQDKEGIIETEPAIVMDNARFTAVASSNEGLATDDEPDRNIASKLVWREDSTLLNSDEHSNACALMDGEVPAVDALGIEELELAAFILAKRTLKAVSADEVASFAPHMQSLYKKMQSVMDRAQQGKLSHQGTGVNWLETSTEFEEKLLERVEKASPDGGLLVPHGRQLPAIMRGEVETVSVFAEDRRIYKFFEAGLGNASTNLQLAKYVDLYAHKKPGMRILEIGGGTGETTMSVLKNLGGSKPEYARMMHYTFTDIRQGLVEKAVEKFRPWKSMMEFKLFNVDDEATKQGFKAGDYDLIIATGAFTNTHVMETTMTNVRSLLKPAGKLCFVEPTQELMRWPMIFGSLPDWWVGAQDPAGRELSPILSERQWAETLKGAGFTGIDMATQDMKDAKNHSLSFMVTTATTTVEDLFPRDIVLVHSDNIETSESRLISTVAEALQAVDKDTVISAVPLSRLDETNTKGKHCISMLEVERPLVAEFDETSYDRVKNLILDTDSCTWLTKGGTMDGQNPISNLMTGWSRCIRSENPNINMTTLDLDVAWGKDPKESAKLITQVFRATLNRERTEPLEAEYAIRNNRVHVPRLVLEDGVNHLIHVMKNPPEARPTPFGQDNRALTLQVGTFGMLDTLQFVEDKDYSKPLKADDVEVEVAAVGLNFFDLMVSMGQIPEPALGVDCAGIVSRVGSEVTRFKPGDRVMSWGDACFSTYFRNPECMIHHVPEGLGMELASSLPVVLTTAYQSLVAEARLQKGETILIHAAAGGLGQAAIMIAQHIGAEVFVTCSSQAKKDMLKQKYGIAEDHMFNSRDLSFAQGVRRMTDGRGVDVCLNSLAGEALRQSWHAMAWFGRFIEVGKKDMVGNTGLDMAPFIRNISFHSVNIIGAVRVNAKKAAEMYAGAMDLLTSGAVRPIEPLTVMDYSRIEEAFRAMQTGRHSGKIVLTAGKEDVVPMVPRGIQEMDFDPNATYVLSGGLGGLGRSMSTFFASHGARHIAFLSRSGARKPDAQKTLQLLEKAGVHCKAFECDIANAASVEKAIGAIKQEFPVIKGCIQGAMQLSDGTFENMDYKQFMTCIHAKVPGSWNLHKSLTDSPLDFFVMLSSSAGIAGNRGQGNYAAGNAFQDALAHHRRLQGMPATTLDVGMVVGVGVVAENEEILDNLKKWSFLAISERELHALLQTAMRGRSLAHGGVNGGDEPVDAQIVTGLGTGGMTAFNGGQTPYWFDDAKFAHMRILDTQKVGGVGDGEADALYTQLAQASSLAAAGDAITGALVKKLAKAMSMAIDDIDVERPVSSYGVDSLVAVELRTWVLKEVQADVSVFDILSNVAMATLCRTIAEKSKAVPQGLE